MFFTSDKHRERFLDALQQSHKVYDGMVDQEYGAAFYILTARHEIWEKARAYTHHSIRFRAMLEDQDLSSGYRALVELAGNLFNDETEMSPVDLMLLDDENFAVAMTAFHIRRRSFHIEEF